MLANPDIAPSASINRWIVSILMFHFKLVHVPSAFHGPDGLSRRKPQPGDAPEAEDNFDDWVDQVQGFLHMILPTSTHRTDQPPATIHILQSFTNDIPAGEENSGNAPQESPTDSYDIMPHSDLARKADECIKLVHEWHTTLLRPESMSDGEYETFLRYCTKFFISANRLWRKDHKGEHKLVVSQDRCLFILTSAHGNTGHHSFFATNALITLRYWWPFMGNDIAWFVKTCQICQMRKTQNLLIPQTVATPTPLFAKIYIDMMHMPPSSGFKHIIQGRCSITHWPEFDLLWKENALTIGEWLLRNFIYHWGTLTKIVSDNGAPFVKALAYLGKRYHIRHIRISGYNSRANGIVERSHFNIWQALFKAASGDASKWSSIAYSVFWADRVTVRKRMGCSPYFAVTGTHPLLPFNIAEASYLLSPPNSILSTTDLIARWAIQLQKRHEHLSTLHSEVFETRLKAAVHFEKEHTLTVSDFNFKLGDLVLLHTRGHRHWKKGPGVNFFLRPPSAGLTNYIIRHMS